MTERDDALFSVLVKHLVHTCVDVYVYLHFYLRKCVLLCNLQKNVGTVCVVVILYLVSSCVCRARDNKQRDNRERQED